MPTGVAPGILPSASTSALGKSALFKSTEPKFTTNQGAAAQAQLRGSYKIVSNSVNTELHVIDSTFARIATASAAATIQTAAIDPVLEIEYRDSAILLAQPHYNMIAAASKGSDSAQFQEPIGAMAAGAPRIERLLQ